MLLTEETTKLKVGWDDDAEVGETLPFFSLISERLNEIQGFSLADSVANPSLAQIP